MAFSGTLKEFKVPDILQLLSLQKKTGILTFNSGEGFVTVIFETGMIVGIDAFPKKLEMRVGNVLVKQDIISEEMLQRALSIQKRTGQKVGEILVGMGLIDDKTIPEALTTQATQIVLSLFKWKKGEYNFKVMEYILEDMKTLSPIATDNLIMEGVQMLDEWPLIQKVIPSDSIIFEPISVDNIKVEIVSEDDEKFESPERNTIYLTETEVSLLKHINGKNSVKDLVEMGIFTEYKIYKNLFNLVNKSIIHKKEESRAGDAAEEMLKEEKRYSTIRRVGYMFKILLVFLILVFISSFLKPLKPLNKENILLKHKFYEKNLRQNKT